MIAILAVFGSIVGLFMGTIWLIDISAMRDAERVERARLVQAFERGRKRPPILLPSASLPAGGITAAQFGANLALVASAMRCPVAHHAAVPVNTTLGERVAWLCPDCDTQLPADWRA